MTLQYQAMSIEYTINISFYMFSLILTEQSRFSIFYYIYCCHMFVFVCPIIAGSQCWLFAFRTIMDIYPQISIMAAEFNFRCRMVNLPHSKPSSVTYLSPLEGYCFSRSSAYQWVRIVPLFQPIYFYTHASRSFFKSL